MVQLQILNKVISSKNPNLLINSNLTVEDFSSYVDEFNFIVNHYKEYKQTPDTETIIKYFPEFDFFNVGESDEYLLDTIREETIYAKAVPIVQKAASLLTSDTSYNAVEYLKSHLSELQMVQGSNGVDLIKQADLRFKEHLKRKESGDTWRISSGFEELDDIIGGWTRGEEFAVIFARTGQGKSWFLAKTATHAWQIGYRVGYISPEMSYNAVGYRFDTLFKHFSNRDINNGVDTAGYEDYIKDLQSAAVPFIVRIPKDFGNNITVTKCRQFVQSNHLDILCIDGIKYLNDERYKKGDNTTTSLTNISEDLISLSLELEIPILVVVQSNRSGVQNSEESGTPELDSIRDSDGISHSATKVISLRQVGPGLEMGIKKNRNGATGGKLVYNWDIDTGNFLYIPGESDSSNYNSSSSSRNHSGNSHSASKPNNQPIVAASSKSPFTDGSSPF